MPSACLILCLKEPSSPLKGGSSEDVNASHDKHGSTWCLLAAGWAVPLGAGTQSRAPREQPTGRAPHHSRGFSFHSETSGHLGRGDRCRLPWPCVGTLWGLGSPLHHVGPREAGESVQDGHELQGFTVGCALHTHVRVVPDCPGGRPPPPGVSGIPIQCIFPIAGGCLEWRLSQGQGFLHSHLTGGPWPP